MITSHQLLQHLQQQSQQQPLLIVAIDGYAGAGKSTLAIWLSQQLPTSQILALDDFYRPLSSQQQQLQAEPAVQAYLPTQLVVEQIMRPLYQGQTAIWRALDWLTQSRSPEKQISAQGVVIVDGVFSTHKDLMPWVDVSIMVSTAIETCQRRVVARPQPDTAWLAHWQTTEEWFHKHNNTHSKVDWVIAGNVR